MRGSAVARERGACSFSVTSSFKSVYENIHHELIDMSLYKTGQSAVTTTGVRGSVPPLQVMGISAAWSPFM